MLIDAYCSPNHYPFHPPSKYTHTHTSIQRAVIPRLLGGENLVMAASTGNASPCHTHFQYPGNTIHPHNTLHSINSHPLLPTTHPPTSPLSRTITPRLRQDLCFCSTRFAITAHARGRGLCALTSSTTMYHFSAYKGTRSTGTRHTS